MNELTWKEKAWSHKTEWRVPKARCVPDLSHVRSEGCRQYDCLKFDHVLIVQTSIRIIKVGAQKGKEGE